MSYIEDDECDYCRGKGWYLMDGVREACFCQEEPAKAKCPPHDPESIGTTHAVRKRCGAKKTLRHG